MNAHIDQLKTIKKSAEEINQVLQRISPEKIKGVGAFPSAEEEEVEESVHTG